MKKKVFVATSSEMLSESFLTNALDRLEFPNSIDVVLWTRAFGKQFDSTLDQLLEICNTFHGAIVILSADDMVEKREQSVKSPRDNLILELGLFLSSFGKQRVLALIEDRPGLPSDLLGVELTAFSRDSERKVRGIAESSIKGRIESFLSGLNSQSTSRDSIVGVDETLNMTMHNLESIGRYMRRGDHSGPMRLSSVAGARYIYKDALRTVHTRFWTTTYLNSDFWLQQNSSILEANQELVGRLADPQKGVPDLRRIFFVSRNLQDEYAFQEQLRRLARQYNLSDEQKLNDEYFWLSDGVTKLVERGFQTKVMSTKGLPTKVLRSYFDGFDSSSHEIALYDNSRIDTFSDLVEVKTFTSLMKEFDAAIRATTDYFEALWANENAVNWREFDLQMKNAIVEADRRLDYQSNWLALYEQAHGDDKDLMDQELAWVLDRIQTVFGRRKLAGVLDVGTCTGRYLVALHKSVRQNGSVVGLDSDHDCVDYSVSKMRRLGIENVSIVWGDITKPETLDYLLGRRFEVITCMMGTLCHLDIGDLENDDWFRALETIKSLLLPTGRIFCATWNSEVCKAPQASLLSIYTQEDKRKLCARSLRSSEIVKRFKKCGLVVESQTRILGKLDVWQVSLAATAD